MEILKQAQFQPLPVEKQVLIIFAATNGYLDDLPVELCRKFEDELYRFVDNAHPGVLNQIREKKAIDDATKAELTKVMKEFKQRFGSDTQQKANA